MADHQEDAPFRNELVVFTGKLSTRDRKQAGALVERLGGHVASDLTPKSTMLVIGMRGAARTTEAKVRRAERLNASATSRIRIVDEAQFCTMAGVTPPAGSGPGPGREYYARRDVLGMYPRLREDHVRYLEKWGVVKPVLREQGEPYFEFSELAVFRQAAAGLEEGLSFRSVLKSLQAARSGQLALDFRLEAPRARIVQLGPKRMRPEGTAKAQYPPLPASPTIPTTAPTRRAEEYFLKASALDHDRATHGEAARWYRRALELDPSLVAALINLANIHYAADRLVEAQALYERAIGLEPGFFEAHFNLGNICHDLNRYEEAAACYAEALALNTTYPEAHFYLAVTLEKLGRSGDAKPHWKAYQDLAPHGEWVALAREFSE